MLKKLFDPGDWLGMKPALLPDDAILSLDHVPSSGEVKLRIGIGVIVLSIVCAVIYFLGDDGFVVLIAGGFGFFGLVNLLYGIIQSRYEKRMLIDGSRVSVRTRSWLGLKQWQEPIASYDGVVLREAHIKRSGIGNIDSTKTYHFVELRHADSDKSLPLHVREEGPPPRDIQEAFARRFQLPALTEEGPEVSVRQSDRLDLAISELPATEDPGKPPRGIKVKNRDGEVRITIGPHKGAAVVISWLFYLTIPLVFGWIVYNVEPEMTLYVIAACYGFFIFMFGIGWLFNRNSRKNLPTFVLADGRLCLRQPGIGMPKFVTDLADSVMPGGREFSGIGQDNSDCLECAGIEQILVDTYVSHRSDGSSLHARILIESDTGRLTYAGSQFDDKRLQWLRDYLIYQLSNA